MATRFLRESDALTTLKCGRQFFVPFILLTTLSVSLTAGVIFAASQAALTIDVQNAELSAVFRKIAEVSGFNLIVSPDVQGTITTRLVEVPWEQALDAILNMYRLTQERYGNVILITPRHDVTRRRQQVLQKRQLDRLGEPTITRVIAINYADAAVLKTHLDKLLGHCAVIGVDARTNTLIITGTPSCLRLHDAPHR